jgi:hypothetical protein
MKKHRFTLTSIINNLKDNKAKLHKVYFEKNEEMFSFHEDSQEREKLSFKYSPFFIFSNNFFNFSVNGSAYGMKLGLKKSDELENLEKQDPEEYIKIDKKVSNPFEETTVEEIKKEEGEDKEKKLTVKKV